MSGEAQSTNSTSSNPDIKERSECAFSTALFRKLDCKDHEVDIVGILQVPILPAIYHQARDILTFEADGPLAVPAHISFEVLEANGAWSECVDSEQDIERPARQTTPEPTVETMRPLADSSLSEFFHDDTGTTAFDPFAIQQSRTVDFTPTYRLSNPAWQFASEIADQNMGLVVVGDTCDSLFDFALAAAHDETQDDIASSVTHEFGYQNILSAIYSLPSHPETLRDLPFRRYQDRLGEKGMCHHSTLRMMLGSFGGQYHQSCTAPCASIFADCPGIDLRSLGSKSVAKRSYETSGSATPFLRDVVEIEASLSDPITPARIPKYYRQRTSLISFQSLLPGEGSPERCENNTDLLTNDAMLENNLIRLLLFSAANGFAGLGDIPIASILKFLNRSGNTDTMFFRILDASPSHVAKSLAESLFRIAIEAQESSIVKRLLGTSLLQINDIVCTVGGRKLTAIERAAQLQDSKTMTVLLDKHADVEKSFGPLLEDRGALKQLIAGIKRGETFTDIINIVEALLHAGQKVDAKLLRDVIERLRHSPLAFCLLQQLLPTHDIDLIANGMFSLVTNNLDEDEACKSTESILRSCQNLHKGRCLQKFERQIGWALVQSAKRGHLRVVLTLLPYSKNLHRILSASLRGGKRDVIEAVFDKEPDLNATALSIDVEEWHDHSLYGYVERSTPLAEAIRTKVEDFVHRCEVAGALDLLHLNGHFEAALAAAATTGNLPYIRKLSQIYSRPSPRDMYAALMSSIGNCHDEISLLLITKGADFEILSRGSERRQSALFAAISRRNTRIVRAILDAGYTEIYPLYYHTAGGKYQTIFSEAIKWGDRSIILDLSALHPGYRMPSFTLRKDTAKLMDPETLKFLVELALLDGEALTAILEYMVEGGNTAMVISLIELGADPSNSSILSIAAKSQPKVLEILLDHIPRPLKRPKVHLGTQAVLIAIGLGIAGYDTLEMLLSSQVVDFRSFPRPWIRSETPLGLAIKHAVDFKGGFPLVTCLLEAGCDPNSVVSVNNGPDSPSPNLSALLAAIATKRIDLVKLLITHGAEVNTEAARRLTRTPLQLAAELGCLGIVQLLLRECADVNALPFQRGGGTALQLAAKSGNCNIAVALLDHDADLYASPSALYGRWPVEAAAEHGRLDMIEFLLKTTVYNAVQCERAMELARENGHLGCQDLIRDWMKSYEVHPSFR
jgi:hypothetical protein